GKDCIKFAPEIKKEIGYLPSEVFYYDNMKVADLLNYSASFFKKDCKKRIKELAEMMDLDLTKKIGDLSLGNKKKVGIVQGLLHSPKLIILDEPTSGLDPLMQQKFFELLEEENEKGATILFSSHILSEVQRLCNRVAIIKEGKIVTVEKISTLKENNYKKFTVDTSEQLEPDFFNMAGVNNIS
ncbi:AAA family ATPase, partial [Paenibacillus sp. MCAF20]